MARKKEGSSVTAQRVKDQDDDYIDEAELKVAKVPKKINETGVQRHRSPSSIHYSMARGNQLLWELGWWLNNKKARPIMVMAITIIKVEGLPIDLNSKRKIANAIRLAQRTALAAFCGGANSAAYKTFKKATSGMRNVRDRVEAMKLLCRQGRWQPGMKATATLKDRSVRNKALQDSDVIIEVSANANDELEEGEIIEEELEEGEIREPELEDGEIREPELEEGEVRDGGGEGGATRGTGLDVGGIGGSMLGNGTNGQDQDEQPHQARQDERPGAASPGPYIKIEDTDDDLQRASVPSGAFNDHLMAPPIPRPANPWQNGVRPHFARGLDRWYHPDVLASDIYAYHDYWFKHGDDFSRFYHAMMRLRAQINPQRTFNWDQDCAINYMAEAEADWANRAANGLPQIQDIPGVGPVPAKYRVRLFQSTGQPRMALSTPGMFQGTNNPIGGAGQHHMAPPATGVMYNAHHNLQAEPYTHHNPNSNLRTQQPSMAGTDHHRRALAPPSRMSNAQRDVWADAYDFHESGSNMRAQERLTAGANNAQHDFGMDAHEIHELVSDLRRQGCLPSGADNAQRDFWTDAYEFHEPGSNLPRNGLLAAAVNNARRDLRTDADDSHEPGSNMRRQGCLTFGADNTHYDLYGRPLPSYGETQQAERHFATFGATVGPSTQPPGFNLARAVNTISANLPHAIQHPSL